MPKFNVGKTKTAKPVRPKLRKPLPYLRGAAEEERERVKIRKTSGEPYHKARRLRQRTLPAREETNAKSYSIHTPH
jgi:hypothetical protein